ncbi:uncharacterized protein H6S33_009404 [Morchella sextelata]|uniref:uncharacterized protein n=1 Tax=Morchella sextelata TaxID=1174677 RepID=UPI001D05118D|nr:uncharacterized protein H6S33_009404 [Morchella sextelata]KAH0613024.1 hypothetical protein H6S33_009404 [Morchella sextelata]
MSTTTNLHPPHSSSSHMPPATPTPGAQTSRQMTLWIHDPDANPTLSRQDAILNYELFAPGIAKPGDIAEVRLLPGNNAGDDVPTAGGIGVAAENMERKRSVSNNGCGEGTERGFPLQPKNDRGEKRFLFVVRKLTAEQRSKPNMQISLANHVANLFGFPSRATVIVSIVEKEHHEASHIEIYFRDQYISRSDMWRMSTALLTDTCPYNAQKLLFIQSVRGTVGNIWVRGEKVQSAYFSPHTVPIFRSESAHYVLFVQMSREMWHFDTDDGGEGDQGLDTGGAGVGVGGEIVFNKLVNGFLPELFKRWKRINAHHLVSIVLFTRVVYEHGEPVGILNGGKESEEFLGTPGGIGIGEGRRYRDFYRVVVSSMASADWTIILHRLKREFTVFLRDVLVQPVEDDEPSPDANSTPIPSSAISTTVSRPGTPAAFPPQITEMLRPASSSTNSQPSPKIPPQKEAPKPKERKTIIAGRPSAAIHGNILEAINLATFQFSQDYVDRDLVRTGISVVIITPGTGHFEVDYDMLKATTDGLIMNGMGVDLVCLSKVPLHTVPLFKYRNPSPRPAPTPNEYHDDKPKFLGVSPPKVTIGSQNSSIPPQPPIQPQPPQLGEWVFAVPHWIDISFWSAASEKKVKKKNNLTGKFEKKKDTVKAKPKSHGFKPRCKMYELQMMGVMETEVSEISVPFIHESPFWQPWPTPIKSPDVDEIGPGTSIAAGKGKAKVVYSKDAFKWMDDYDEAVFAPLPKLRELEKAARERKLGSRESDDKKLRLKLEEDPMVLGTSFHGEAQRGQLASLAASGFFDRKMKAERQPADLDSPIEARENDVMPHHTAQPQMATIAEAAHVGPTTLQDMTVIPQHQPPQPQSQPQPQPGSGGILGKPTRLVRNISFGFKWGAAKATAKTGLVGTETAAGTGLFSNPGSGVMVTRGFDTGENSILAPPKSPLSPRMSDHGSSAGAPSPEKLGWGSRPISIKNNAISSLEAASRERERRRSFAGSPLEGRGGGGGNMDILKAAGMQRRDRPAIDIAANQDKMAVIPTVSPTSALAPWVQVLNPSNPKKNPPSVVNQFRRWHHVFPKPLKISTVKWKSLCSPAALPLTTEHFPTAEQLRDEYQENPYVICQNEIDEPEDSVGNNREELVRAMIGQRLAQGFQIVVGSSVKAATGGGGDTNIYEPYYMVKAGSSCFMSLGSQIHQLICDEEYNVEVKRYVRKPMAAIPGSGLVGAGASNEYISYMKTIMSDKYLPVKASFKLPITEYNWNYVDQYIGGYEDSLTEQLRYWRARFVLIPNDPPESARKSGMFNRPGRHDQQGQLEHITELNDEEIRLEGIKKLTQLFQRNRYIPPEERQYSSKSKGKEKDPLQILYKTFDPSVVVAQELESLPPAENNNMRRSQLLSTELFDKRSLDIVGVAQELQGPRGVRLENRRWHLRYHTNCFVGDEMVTWILENFKEVCTRAEAEDIGAKLFKAGLFQHVDKRHEFRDGNYFYRIAEQFVVHQPRPTSKGTGWFGGFNTKSVPATPSSVKDESISPLRSRSSTMMTDDSSEGSCASGFRTPTPVPKKKAEVELSKVMKYDVDPGKKSYRKEIINLHYDRLHNPDNCYHIRIDWMNTTSKLIEDSLTSWARTIDRYGLKLVEAPIDEVSTIPIRNPFRSPYIIKFSSPPPQAPPSPQHPPAFTQPSSPTVENMEMSTILTPLPPPPHPPANNDPHFYHKAALKKFGFVLDIESARNFPADVKVKYSWGVPNYRWSQYIHKTGSLFVQVNDEGHFLMMANRSYSTRVNRITPPSGPPPPPEITPEALVADFESFCNEPETLKKFFKSVVISSKNVITYDDASLGAISASMSSSRVLSSPFPRIEPPVFPAQLASPVLGPLGAGSPTTGASTVHGVGRSSMGLQSGLQSGRSSIADVPEDFHLSLRYT